MNPLIIECRKAYYLNCKRAYIEQLNKYKAAKKLYLDTLKDVKLNSQTRNEDSDGYSSDSSESGTESSTENL